MSKRIVSQNEGLSIRKLIGGGYDRFWHFKGRYRVVKGSRGSKKSCTTALWYIFMMMKYYHTYGLLPNLLVIRKWAYLNKNSTRAQLIWAMDKLGVRSLWRIPKGEFTLTYIPSGQSIYFRGLDDTQSLTSIVADVGQLCWVWFEEAYQVGLEDDFNKIDLSIRGDMPEGLFKQITLSFNPWSDKHWMKKRFFDVKDPNILAMTTNYMCNEFLGKDDIALFEQMKVQNPKRYRIEGLGEWGVSEGLVYSNWIEEYFDINEILKANENKKDSRGLAAMVSCHGMVFGYNDPTAFVGAYADKVNYKIYIFYELFEHMIENKKIAERLIDAGFGKSSIIGDCADSRSINELRLLGLRGLKGCRKTAGFFLGGVQKLQDYQIIVHPNCPHVVEALSNYAWKIDRNTGRTLNEPEHEYSHLPDALLYGTENLSKFGIMV